MARTGLKDWQVENDRWKISKHFFKSVRVPVATGRRHTRKMLMLAALLAPTLVHTATVYKEWVIHEVAVNPDGFPRTAIGVFDKHEWFATTPESQKPEPGYGPHYDIIYPLPGPEVRMRPGDRVVIAVTNLMDTQSTSIHWHGIHQHLQAWMDGVPGLTQCAIAPGETFTPMIS